MSQDTLYCIYNPLTKLTKIGITSFYRLDRRLNELNNQNGCKLDLIAYTRMWDDICECSAKENEAIIHEQLKDKRKVGEWFDIKSKRDFVFLRNRFVETGGEGIYYINGNEHRI